MMNTALAEQVQNPFADAPVAARPQGGELMAQTGSARETAEVQTAMVMARRFPRNPVEVMDSILQACTRPSLAQGALYEYARGGTEIRGPSIRLAECIAQYWGHLDFGWRVLEERMGVSKVQAFAWDMQTGTRSQMVFDVEHVRHTRQGRTSLTDPRDIYELIANAASRRLRACILRVIPGDVVEAATAQCERTLTTKVEVTPERIQNLLAQFADYGVTKTAIEKRIQRRIEALSPSGMVVLGKIYTSMKDGMSQPGDWFDLGADQGAPGAASGKPESVGPRAAVKRSLEARKAAQAHSQPDAPPQPQPGEVPPPDDPLPVGPTEPMPEPIPVPPPTPPHQAPAGKAHRAGPSDALVDVVHFAKVAKTEEDIERAATIAMQIEDEAEVKVAQEHLDAARTRIGA